MAIRPSIQPTRFISSSTSATGLLPIFIPPDSCAQVGRPNQRRQACQIGARFVARAAGIEQIQRCGNERSEMGGKSPHVLHGSSGRLFWKTHGRRHRRPEAPAGWPLACLAVPASTEHSTVTASRPAALSASSWMRQDAPLDRRPTYLPPARPHRTGLHYTAAALPPPT